MKPSEPVAVCKTTEPRAMSSGTLFVVAAIASETMYDAFVNNKGFTA